MKLIKTYQGQLPENKILNTKSTSQTDTYSCDYINKNIETLQKRNNYYTEEQITGNWIDGKPIYRKVIVNTIKKSGSNIFDLSSVGLNNVDKYITLKSISNGDPINEDYYTTNADLLRTLINYNGLYIQLGTSYPSVPCLVYTIVEYTKTTD